MVAMCPLCYKPLSVPCKIRIGGVSYFVCDNCFVEMYKYNLMNVTGIYVILQKLIFGE